MFEDNLYRNINCLPPYFYMSIVTSNIQKHCSILTVFKSKHHVAEAPRKKFL